MTDTLPLSERARELLQTIGVAEDARSRAGTPQIRADFDAHIAVLEAELFEERSFRWNFRTPGQLRLEHSYPVDWLADEYAGVEVLVRGARLRIERVYWRPRLAPPGRDVEPGWEDGCWTVVFDGPEHARPVGYFPKFTVLDLAPMVPDEDFAEDPR